MEKRYRKLRQLFFCFLASAMLVTTALSAKEDKNGEEENGNGITKEKLINGLKFRALGPGLKSGRIGDFAVDPDNPARYYVAVCSGGVWMTENSGTTYKSIFDGEKSYSIGCITMDPNNPHTIWVGTGENNSQRSVSWGDGIYRSLNGGKSWEHMGLKESEHIAKIIVHPDNSNVVFVASQGPLWGPGGDRGVFMTRNGGKDWENILFVSENTGVTDLVMDPRNPDVMYAASYQRRRHVWTLVNGGPESAIYKTTDGGKNWRKIEKGLPSGDVGRIGLAISPVDPDVVYAIIEAANESGGFFRSTDRGESWEKRNSYIPRSPQYYSEIVCDPKDVNKVYSLDTWTKVTDDGGKTFRNLGNNDRHVDDHALWIDPEDTGHLLIGGDGGIYESWDAGDHWHFKTNLPVTQFYRVSVDNDLPFYNIYGGTQDNNTIGGPSQTLNAMGISNYDWFITKGGDGFETVVDPEDPNIVYSQSQYGWLVRYDKQSGESVGIKPMEKEGEQPYRWNWDSPLIISHHDNERLYFAANKVFRSDDRGNTWQVVSPDLTRQIDRNKLEIMDRVWSVDAVSKNASTSIYGNIVSLTESPKNENLLYAGTDDGLVRVTEDGGVVWAKIESFPGVPDLSYVSDLLASMHDENTVYACFDNHKMADFSPYVLKSTDKGRTWTSIASNLPDDEPVYTIVEDHVRPGMLFAGTEYSVYCSLDGGGSWTKLSKGVPPIAMKDIEIQRRENDLVLGTFGRGFYVLDDYSPLRDIDDELLEKEAHIFPIKDALLYIQKKPYGSYDNGNQGATFFTTPNPPYGAVFTVYLKEKLTSLKQERQSKEKELIKADKPAYYPSWDSLRKEDDEQQPYLLAEIRDEDGRVIRYLREKPGKGLMRFNWNLRGMDSDPVRRGPEPGKSTSSGLLVTPETYSMTLYAVEDGERRQLAGPEPFVVKALNNLTLPPAEKAIARAFYARMYTLNRDAQAALKVVEEMHERSRLAQEALQNSYGDTEGLHELAVIIEKRMLDLKRDLRGDRTLSSRNAPVPQSVLSRIQIAGFSSYNARSVPTQTMTESLDVAEKQLNKVLEGIEQTRNVELKMLEEGLDRIGAPYTPGRW